MKVGIYLGAAPTDGGAFQYSLSILEAAATLPRGSFRSVVAYRDAHWAGHLDVLGLADDAMTLPATPLDRSMRWLLKEGVFPLAAWHAIARRWHRTSIAMREAQCDLWVFPNQDVMTYAFPGPTLGVVHDLMHRYEARFPEVGNPTIARQRDRHYQQMCRRATGLLVDSPTGRDHLLESYGPSRERVHVLPYVAPAYMTARRHPEMDAMVRGLPSRYFLYPAQLWRHKNHLGLLQAFLRVRRDVPDIHLVLVGSDKNGATSVRAMIEALSLQDCVHVLGYVRDQTLPELYRRARALVMPTFFGPTNIPPLEAMAVGCPMAVSRIYGMPAQVGDAALCFDPGSVDELTNAMLQLATDDALCARLSVNGLRRAAEWQQGHFNLRFLEILETVQAARLANLAGSPETDA